VREVLGDEHAGGDLEDVAQDGQSFVACRARKARLTCTATALSPPVPPWGGRVLSRAFVFSAGAFVLSAGCTDERVLSGMPAADLQGAVGGSGGSPNGGEAGAADGIGGGGGVIAGANGVTTGLEPAFGSVGGASAVGGAGPAAGGGGAGAASGVGGTGASDGAGATGGAGAAASGGSGGSAVDSGGSSNFAGAAGAPDELPLEGEPCVGYTLIGSPENDAGADFAAFLVDMDGNEVHRWNITGFPPKMLPGGSLVGCTGVFPSSYDCVQMLQVSWEGEIEWSFDDFAALRDGGTAARHHHDFQRDGNPVGYYAPGHDFVSEPNTLVLAHDITSAPEIRDGELDDDVIYEVDWSGERTGFEWRGVDHVAEFGFDQAALDNIKSISATRLEWLHGNAISRLGPNHWYDAGRKEFHPDNILYSSRRANLIVVIDHATGEVVWRVGPDFAGRPEEPLGQFMGQHMPHMIPRGLPGAGNILVFDNGTGAGYGRTTPRREWSRVVEFDPTTFEIVWQYGSASGTDRFVSPIVSGAQRLPNGNTLITIGVSGLLIEVTPSAEIVWEYQYDASSSGSNASWVYRAYRIPPEWLPLGENAAHANYPSWQSLFEVSALPEDAAALKTRWP